MQDGLYSVKFQTPVSAGSGVIIKNGDKIAGGDTAFAWTGTLQEEGSIGSGRLDVQKHDDSMTSVFGPLTSFTLSFSGSVQDSSAKFSATTPAAPGVNMSVTLAFLKAV